MMRLWIAVILILTTALLRCLLRRTLPQRVAVFCWLLCMGVLLLPWELHSELSVYRLLPEAVVSAQQDASAALKAVLPVSLRGAASAVLLAGLSVVYVRELLRFHRAAPATAPAVRRWQVLHPLRRPLRIRCSDRAQTPVCCGILFPVILLPTSLCAASEETLDCVLSHEYCHILRFDPLWKLLALVCVCLYWYLPPVWLLWVLLGRDLEFACDEDVLKTGVPGRAYCRTLLELALARHRTGTLTAHFAAGQIGCRVDRMRTRPCASAIRLLCAAFMLALSLVLAAAPPVTARSEAADAHLVSDHIVFTVPVLEQDRSLLVWKEVP